MCCPSTAAIHAIVVAHTHEAVVLPAVEGNFAIICTNRLEALPCPITWKLIRCFHVARVHVCIIPQANESVVTWTVEGYLALASINNQKALPVPVVWNAAPTPWRTDIHVTIPIHSDISSMFWAIDGDHVTNERLKRFTFQPKIKDLESLPCPIVWQIICCPRIAAIHSIVVAHTHEAVVPPAVQGNLAIICTNCPEALP